MSNEKLSGIEIPQNGRSVFQEDWRKEQDAKSEEIIARDQDCFGIGIHSGGSIGIGSGPTVNLTEATIAYDVNGRRISVPVTNGIAIPADSSGKLVVRHKFETENHSDPGNVTGNPVVHLSNGFEILFRTGELDPADVALREVTNTAGTITLGADLRTWRGLSGRQISDDTIDERSYKSDSISNRAMGSDVKIGSLASLRSRIITEINDVINNAGNPNHDPAFGNSIVSAITVVDRWLEAAEQANIENRKEVAEPFYLPYRKSVSSAFPAVDLLSDRILSVSGATPGTYYPLIGLMRDLALEYDPSGVPQTEFETTAYAVVSNIASVTFASGTPIDKILTALGADQIEHGSYSNWRTLTLNQAHGPIPAGTYAITNLDLLNRKVYFPFTNPDSSGSVSSKTVSFYSHRIPDSEDAEGVKVKLWNMKGRALHAAGDADGHFVAGLRLPGQMQGFQIGANPGTPYYAYALIGTDDNGSPAGNYATLLSNIAAQGVANMLKALNNGNDGDPITGKITHSPSFSGIPYLWIGRILTIS